MWVVGIRKCVLLVYNSFVRKKIKQAEIKKAVVVVIWKNWFFLYKNFSEGVINVP